MGPLWSYSQTHFLMKQIKQITDQALTSLHKKVINTQKAAEKALADYNKKLAACEEASDKKLDKSAVYELVAALKIAKYTHKIKKTEYKLAKKALKAAGKKEQKNSDVPAAANKETPKLKKTTVAAKSKKGESVSDQGKAIVKNKKTTVNG